jgi:hypothetical protein
MRKWPSSVFRNHTEERAFSENSVFGFSFALACCFLGLIGSSEESVAQTAPSYAFDFYKPQTLIAPTIPAGYDRGGNVSIDEQPRPDYQPLPIQVGSFNLYPELDTYVGGSSNVLLSQSDPKPDLLVGSAISLFVFADWGNSSLMLSGKDWENVWVHNAVRSQDQGNIDASYQFDITDHLQAAVEGSFLRYGDNNAIGTLNTLGSVLGIVQQTISAGRIQYVTGHFSQILSIDRQHFEADPIYSEQTGLEQNYMNDHTFVRLSSQTEYALSANASIFLQLSGYTTTYATLLPGNLPNYNSHSFRNLAGISLDLPGFLRGQVALGLGHRYYDSPLYHTPTGLVVASKLEFLLDSMNNFTFVALKDFDDGAIFAFSSIKYESYSFVYEHEFRKNITGGFRVSKYDASPLSETQSAELSQFGGEIYGKYMLNHHFSVKWEIGGERTNYFSPTPPKADTAPNTEFRGLLTLSFNP